jgi:formylglycine-generating enzyme required for sulfatase activity
MENKYDKNMEALLQKAFLAQDLEASKNEGLLAASSQATLGIASRTAFFSTANLFKGVFFMTAVFGVIFGWNTVFKAESRYVPIKWSYNLPAEHAEELETMPTMDAVRIKTEIIDQVKKTKPLIFELPDMQPADSMKVYTPEKVPSVFIELTPEQTKEHLKEKEKFMKDVTKLDKDIIAHVEVFSQFIRKGEKALNNFAIWKTEISNAEYRLFLNDLIVQNRMKDYKVALYDSATWTRNNFKSFFEPMQNMYHWHPAYDDYPVVNISRAAANLYCAWLTDEISKKKDDKIEIETVRIPTNREWEYAASSGGKMKPYSWGGPYLTNSEGCYLANFRPGSQALPPCIKEGKTMDDVKLTEENKSNAFLADGGLITVKVDSYNPNEMGLYNVSGNVSEMVYYPYDNNTIGARGGDWWNDSTLLKIYGNDAFLGVKEPQSNVGFRPVISYKVGSPISRTFKDFISNPILTEKEKTENKKRKEELIKQIIKLDHDYYTDVLHGEMELEGEKVSLDKFIANRLEVSVINYKTFLFDLIIQKRFDEFHLYKPKRETWGLDSAFYNFHVHDYLIHPAHNNRPILNISIDGAEAFCKWLFEETKKSDFKNRTASLKAIRIPTYEEWMFLATNKGALDNGKTVIELQRKIDADSTIDFCDNFSSGRNPDKSIRDKFIFTGPVISCTPSESGLYNILGNAAEMVKYQDGEYGSKGGSWSSSALDLDFYAKDDSKGDVQPNAEIGFRFVLEWDISEVR